MDDLYKKNLSLLIIQSMRAGFREMKQRDMYIGEYSPNYYFHQVICYMLENRLKSIVDLGAGIGHNLEMCRRLGMKVQGYENDPELLKYAFPFVDPADVTRINPSQIHGFDVVYAYGPTRNQEENEEFVNYMHAIMHDRQTFIYYGIGDKELQLANEQGILQ